MSSPFAVMKDGVRATVNQKGKVRRDGCRRYSEPMSFTQSNTCDAATLSLDADRVSAITSVRRQSWTATDLETSWKPPLDVSYPGSHRPSDELASLQEAEKQRDQRSPKTACQMAKPARDALDLTPHIYGSSTMKTLQEEPRSGWPLPDGRAYDKLFKHPLWSSTPTLMPSKSKTSCPHVIVGMCDPRGKETTYDPNLVAWTCPQDPTNASNWSNKKKWTATIMVSLFSFLSPFASSMIAPALVDMALDLRITSKVEIQMCFSVYILGFAFGPLLLAPISEIYGRVWTLQISMLLFFAFNLGCGFARNSGMMIAFRFLSGVGGSSPLVIGGGVISDCWNPEQRGKAIAIYALAPLLGPAIGPIYAGFLVSATTWRWLFWSISIADALIQFLGCFLLSESFGPRILQNKARNLRRMSGISAFYAEADQKTISQTFKPALERPFRLLCTQPIVQVISLYMAYVFGLFYLLLSNFPSVWQGIYHESVAVAGLNYLSLGIGYLIGAQISAHLNDRIYRHLKGSNDNKGKPEFRVPLMFIGSVLMPVGLFWYGWAAQGHAHWIVPNLGIAIFAVGSVICLQCMQTYIIDSYTRFAASGMAAAVVLRSVAGFGFPLFADYMYRRLGMGWGTSLLGFLGILIGIPAPFMFWYRGESLRKQSSYAAG